MATPRTWVASGGEPVPLPYRWRPLRPSVRRLSWRSRRYPSRVSVSVAGWGSCCVGKQLKHLALCCFARLDFLETAFSTFPQEGSRQPTTYLSEPSFYF